MSNLKDLTDEQILDEFDKARGTMSYYNAAEGNWSQEAEGRGKARDYLNAVGTELRNRGLEGRPGDYLC